MAVFHSRNRSAVAGLLLSVLIAALGTASARANAPHGQDVKPAGLDDAEWTSLQEAVRKTASQQARLSAGSFAGADGAADDGFGVSVALDGDTALVGTSGDDVEGRPDQGSAYVFVRSGSGWAQQAKLTANDGAIGDGFGNAVALDGDTALVGASGVAVGENADQGAVYVFVRSGSAWTQQAKLTASDGEAADSLGSAVSLDGDTALVGAFGDNLGIDVNQGSAYVFVRSGSVWSQQAKLSADDGAANDFFGLSVSIDGNTALVGAPLDDVGSNDNQGSAYVFARSGSTWSQQAKLTAVDGALDDQLGSSVALSGDAAIVGAPFGNLEKGAAYVFARSGSAWMQQAELEASDGAPADRFGASVALEGGTALVGASRDDVGANVDQGSAYVFERLGSAWTQQAKLTATESAELDYLGFFVALDGERVLLGALGDDVGGNRDQGSVAVFERSGSAWAQQSLLTSGAGATNKEFGYAVAIRGDTALVGAYNDDVDGKIDQGSAYVFVRSGTTWSLQAELTASDGVAGDSFGAAVDLDGDTALIGSSRDTVGFNARQGSAYVFTRNGSIWVEQAKLTATDGALADRFGYAVAIDGDTALVTAPFHDLGGNSNQGAAYVFARIGSSWSQQSKLSADDGASSDSFGFAASIDDDTALIGVPLDDVAGNVNQGSAYVFRRAGSAWVQQSKLTASDGEANDQFAGAISLDADMALVGAHLDDIGANGDQGSAYVFARSASAWAQQAKLIAGDGASGDKFGYSVSLVGGVAALGALEQDIAANRDQGAVYVFAGSGSPWAQRAKLTAADGSWGAQFGTSVALDGDLLLVGAAGENGSGPFGNPGEGAAYVFSGLQAPGGGRNPQSITFANPGPQSFGTSPTLNASASSGLPVSFSSTTMDVCTVSTDGVLAFASAGVCSVDANQAGNASFGAAPTATQSFAVNAVVPGAPFIGLATAGNGRATVTFAAPASNGGAPITSYAVTSTPGNVSAVASGSPITVSGLSNGTSYFFTVTATNSAGTGEPSDESNSVVPDALVAELVARPDRAIAQVGGDMLLIDVMANDSIDTSLRQGALLAIEQGPSIGSASVTGVGEGQRLAFSPPSMNGSVSLRYSICTLSPASCSEAQVQIEVRPLAVSALQWTTDTERGFRDVGASGLPALPAARFNAFGLVAPVVRSVQAMDMASASAPWVGGRTVTTLRTLPVAVSAATWRVLVDAAPTGASDVDLFLGIDSNGNGLADAGELICTSAMATSERCDLRVDVAAGQALSYWALVRTPTAGETARLDLFETPTAGPAAASRTMTATGPGVVAAGDGFPLRFVWDEPTFLPGQSRGGWLELLANDGVSLGWVPVRIDRTAGAPTAFALASGIDHTIALSDGMANERLYIDVPAGATRLEVTTTTNGATALYLAGVPAPAASSAIPTVPMAPARSAATVSAATPAPSQQLVVDDPAVGRWYVTPVNASLGTAEVIVRATITGTAPTIAPGGYFNPERSGNGLFLYPVSGQRAGLWFTYLQDGSPTWYYLQAAEPGANGVWRSPIHRSAWDGDSNRLTTVGEATVTPDGTGGFTFSYTLDGQTGSEAYRSFGGGCPTVGGQPLRASGLWFNPATAGSGYAVQFFPNYEFHLVFGYDSQGVPRYLNAERAGVGAAGQAMDLNQLTGACPLCARTGDPQRARVGTLTRTIAEGTLSRFVLNASYINGVPGTWAANDAVIPLAELQACSSN